MTRFLTTSLTVISLFLLCSCNGTGNSESAVTLSGPAAKLVGRWITTCLDNGSGGAFQLIVDVRTDGKLFQVYKLFPTDPSCTTGAEYHDPNTDAITTNFAYTETISAREVADIETDFVIAKSVDVSAEVNYVGFYVGRTDFDELHVFPDINVDEGPVWNDWLTNVAGLQDFVNDPVDPLVNNSLHLSRTSESPH